MTGSPLEPPLRLLDCFSGIGGFSLAADQLGGLRTVRFIEADPFCWRVLRRHWPEVPLSHDICTYRPQLGEADVITAGFPCTDISVAGPKTGIVEGNRSGLFYDLMRVVRVVRPRYVVLENVSAILTRGLDVVLAELAKAGFDAEWCCFRASDVGAFHRRDRFWLVAYPIGDRAQGHVLKPVPWEPAIQRVESLRGFAYLRDGPPAGTPRLLRGDDGLPDKLDRLRVLGNSVVPAVAMVPLARVVELELQRRTEGGHGSLAA